MNIRNKSLLLVLVMACLVSTAMAGVSLDGTDDHLTSTQTVGDVMNIDTLTIAVWANFTGTPPSSSWCIQGDVVTGEEWGILAIGRVNNGADVFCGETWDDTGSAPVTFTTAFASGWHHLAMTLGAGTLTVYVDGVSIGSGAQTNLFNTDPQIRIGSNSFDANFAQVEVSEVRYYDVALNAGQIAILGQSRLFAIGGQTPTMRVELMECARGASGDGVTFIDRSGNGRSATGNNGANNTGLTCQASNFLSYPWGVE